MAENKDSLINRVARFSKKVFSCMLLKKKMERDEETDLKPYVHLRDIFLITVGVVLSSYYEGMPRIISSYGYMIIFPLLLSGIMSFITNICFAELVCLNPNSGGSYRYVYYTMGELMAFLVGWSCIYSSFLEIVRKTATITKTIDRSIFNGIIGNFTATNLAIGGLENYFLYVLPNVQLQNIVILLTIAGCFVFSVHYGIIIVDIIAVFNILIVCCCITIFWFYMDLSMFNILGGVEDFSFFSKGAVEGHLFYVDFEISIFGGAEAFNPTVNIPKGMVEGFHVGFLIYMVSIILYSAREGVAREDDGDPVMAIALWHLGFKFFYLLPPIGLVLCHYLSGRAAVYKGSRVMYTMAKDGLFFPIFGRVHPRLRNPYNAHIFIAVICGILSIFIGIAPSTKWSVVGMETIVRITTLLAYLITRYQCDSDDLSFEQQVEHKRRWVLINYPRSLKSPTKTTHSVSMYLIFLSVVAIILAELIMVFYIIETNNQQIYLRLGLVFAFIFAIIAIHLLNRQPVNDRQHYLYKARGAPITPILAIGWYTLILMLLPQVIWIKIFLWWIIGILFYFGYACLRSKEFRKQEDEREEIPDESFSWPEFGTMFWK